MIGNTLESGHVLVGELYTSETLLEDAVNCTREANTRSSGAPAHTLLDETGTVVNPTTAEVYDSALALGRLTAAQVGMGAPDPLCPLGPQS